MYLSAFQVIKDLIHLFQVAQIAALQWDKALTKIPAKYVNYADIFLFNLVIEFLKNTDINKYIIGHQQVYHQAS